MRFWDSSALVPLLVDEPTTTPLRKLLADGLPMVVWALSPVEVASALYRRVRSGELDERDALVALSGLRELERAWNAVIELDRAGGRARRLLAVHPLRAVDSLQLGAALVACGEQPESLPFVTLDEQLAAAARREGFEVWPGPTHNEAPLLAE